jgi:ubiquinone/menaquinone biosynthesis C-methylase UbiE
MDPIEIHSYLSKTHRNIYQEALLFEQSRRPVSTYLQDLTHPLKHEMKLKLDGDKLIAENGDVFLVNNNVIDFRNSTSKDSDLQKKWDDLNKYLVNYQEFLTPYTLLNSLPIYSYIGEKTGLNKIKNAKVVDVGAGTGQIYGTFFFDQESIDYFLLDPNLRLIHDQFLRLYPKLTTYPVSHVLCYAENLPFKSNFADLVMSISSIDHFKDYKQFIKEAFRILQPGGQILIASHLDSVREKKEKIIVPKELIAVKTLRSTLYKIYNRIVLKCEYYARKYHNKKRGKVEDDHMHHFEDTKVLEQSLANAGFKVEQAEVFNHNFFIKAQKPKK